MIEKGEKENQDNTVLEVKSGKQKAFNPNGSIGSHIKDKVGNLVNSYTPTQANNAAILDQPSFENCWYAVAYPWQIDGYEDPVSASIGRKKNKEKGRHPAAAAPVAPYPAAAATNIPSWDS